MARILFAAVLAVCSCLCVVGASLPGGSLSVPVVRNPNYVPNGPLEYAKALSKWGVKLPKGLARHVFTKGESKLKLFPDLTPPAVALDISHCSSNIKPPLPTHITELPREQKKHSLVPSQGPSNLPNIFHNLPLPALMLPAFI